MTCDVCGRNLEHKSVNKAFGMILCCKHYQQKLKYGHI